MRERYHQSTLYFRPLWKEIYNSTRNGKIAKYFERLGMNVKVKQYHESDPYRVSFR